LGYDDALDVFGIHGICGIVGTISVGFFATSAINSSIKGGLLYGNPGQLGIQLLAVLAIGAYSLIMTLIIGKIIDKTIGLRVENEQEINGLDITLHEESGYRLS
jgi:Amt family ammonium transporter